MIPKRWKLSWIPAVLVALVIAACGDQAGLPSEITAPDGISAAKGGKGVGSTKGKKVGQQATVTGVAADGSIKTWKIARGKMPADVEIKDEQVIGAEGGYLYAAHHALYVPKGAVSVPTKFKITIYRKPADPLTFATDSLVNIEVSLKAYETRDGVDVSVGEFGFQRPVYLGLSYDWVADVMDPAQATVLWRKTADVGIEVPTRTVDTGKRWIVGELQHFSDYALAWP